MKKIKQLLLILCFFYYPWFNFSYASVIPIHSNEFSVISQWKPDLMVSEFVKTSLKELATKTGKKINLPERLSFRIIQGRMKRYLKHHPDILVTDYLEAEESEDSHLKFLWIFFGVVIIVVVVLLFSAIK